MGVEQKDMERLEDLITVMEKRVTRLENQEAETLDMIGRLAGLTEEVVLRVGAILEGDENEFPNPPDEPIGHG